ncbi:Sterigmatocystin biosynthesis regulatory protein [Podospora fimiseda]|uniref:Sterigmatocystin biosynthesis regulatory protein n=1 Tax=Podospora fimiseda TaxID=252190 RepID=A0AAN7BH59_9PEZI|nr:Sterigmatocystin biosynthesis regulatory protein [Podospora fimiseda]
MVGVPGRSKGCLTCRKRRKGCDLEKPACSQCKKAGIECGGYDTPRVFVVSTPTTRRAGYRSTPQGAAVSSWQRGGGASGSSNTQVTVANTLTNTRLLGRPEAERRCIDLFWEGYFPTGKPIPAPFSKSYTCSWTGTAQKLYAQDDSLRFALWANALLMTGRREGTEWMLREGSKMYGKALAGLRKSLESPQGAKRDAVIATVKLVSMFEAFSRRNDTESADAYEPPVSQNWQRHCAGELALFMARTPAAHVDGSSHDVFVDERVDLALSGILRRRRLLFSAPEWKIIPWQGPIPRDLKDMLVDVLVDVPGLVEDYDRMEACPNPAVKESLRIGVVARCWELDRNLGAWFNIVSSFISPDNPPPEFVTDLVMLVARMHGMMVFWTSSMVIFTILHLASGSQAHLLPSRMDPMFFALKLANTALPILLQPRAGLYGQHSVVLPLEILLQFKKHLDRVCPSQESKDMLAESVGRLQGQLGKVGWQGPASPPPRLLMA